MDIDASVVRKKKKTRRLETISVNSGECIEIYEFENCFQIHKRVMIVIKIVFFFVKIYDDYITFARFTDFAENFSFLETLHNISVKVFVFKSNIIKTKLVW